MVLPIKLDSFFTSFTSRDENIRNENDLPGKELKKGEHNG